MKSFFNGLLIITGGAAAAVGVLTAVQQLLQQDPEKPKALKAAKLEAMPAVAARHVNEPRAAAAVAMPKTSPDRNFSIKRTKSEVGYVYWILEGFGKYKCFVLCDTWDEAVAQAKAKMAEVDAAISNAQTVSAGV